MKFLLFLPFLFFLNGCLKESKSVASAPGIPGDSTKVAGAAVSLSFSTSLTAIDAGVCTMLTVSLNDSSNIPSSRSQSTEVNLLGQGQGQFFSDSNCTTAITETSIPANQSSTNVYYKNNSRELVQLTAEDQSFEMIPGEKIVSVSNLRILNLVATSNDSYPHICAMYSNGKFLCSNLDNNPAMTNAQSTFRIFQFTNTSSIVPEFATVENVTQLMISSLHACAIIGGTQVYCWGQNTNGKLGIGSTTTQLSPALVNFGSGTPLQLVSQSSTTCLLIEDAGTRSVKCWGFNGSRDVGDLTTTQRNSPVLAQITVPTGATINKLVRFASPSGFAAVLSNGQVAFWGNGLDPQTVALTNVVEYSQGLSHSCYIKSDSKLYCSGSNSSGQLGQGNFNAYGSEVEVTTVGAASKVVTLSNRTCALKTNGAVYCWGDGKSKPMPFLSDLSATDLISVGTSRFCALGSNQDQVYCIDSSLSLKAYNHFSAFDRLTMEVIENTTTTCNRIRLQYLKNKTETAVSASLSFDLQSLEASANFYSDSSCTNSISRSQISSGQIYRDVYYRWNTAGDRSKGVLALKATPTEPGVTPAIGTSLIGSDPYGLSLPGVPGLAGSCLGFVMDIRDEAGRLSTPLSPISFSLSATNGMTFYNDFCSSAPNASFSVSSASFLLYNQTPDYTGTVTISGSTLPGNLPGGTVDYPTTVNIYEYY